MFKKKDEPIPFDFNIIIRYIKREHGILVKKLG